MIYLIKQNKYLGKIIIGCIFLITVFFLCFKIATRGIHGNPSDVESWKIASLFCEINKYQQEFFIKNNRYGSLQELEKEYFSPQMLQILDAFKIFKIVLWSDRKSFQCIASTPSAHVVFKIDETGVLKRKMEFSSCSITEYFEQDLQTGCYDLENRSGIDKTYFGDTMPNSKK